MNVNRLKDFWRRPDEGLWPWIETLILTALVLFLCHVLHPQNPFFIREIFPWPWIATLIIVLKYGFGPGAFSGAIIAGALILQGHAGAISTPDYQNYLLSGFFLTFLCALFSSSWVRRVTRAEELRIYTEERLDSLTRSYFLLHVSYNYLEENLISQPITLRSTMEKLQKMLMISEARLTPDLTQRFLELTNQLCSITTAGIYLWKEGKLSQEPIASVGSMENLVLDDPLIDACLRSTDLCYTTMKHLNNMNQARYLVAAPLRTSQEKLLGILVIKEMSFWALNSETLNALSALISYFSEEIVLISEVTDFIRIYPHCLPQFAGEFLKLLALKKRLNVNSALVAIIVTQDLQHRNVIDNLIEQKRNLDSFWKKRLEGYDILITLMPFTQATGVSGYLNRINAYLQANLGLKIDQTQIRSRSLQLTDAPPATVMNDFLATLEEAVRVH